ncbi:SSI family serine proteinase inhibitor [Streptomyces avicenniae]|uniref:SSI family serine proteinase inhibitor n=1 Tax=Streptomyces avicenniae TaxID=500153 RepID=UPI0006994F6D|nr:SSI family serine proteinase inhibitor [Streptomyces avicenniae]
MSLRKSLVAATVLAASLALPSPAVAAEAREAGGAAHRLTITVSGAGEEADGRHELECAPVGGTHPDPEGACEVLRGAREPFATTTGTDGAEPLCTYVYGGPATATVEGVWDGRPVHAEYDRTNGCEIARWDALVPVLPGVVT